MKQLYLKKNEEKRLLAGHLWVFANEVDAARSPLPDFEPGENVTVVSATGRPLAAATVSPHGLICARVHGREVSRKLDAELLRERLAAALALRERFFTAPYYRLCHAEGDLLPGLTVDRYGELLVLQITAPGMDRVQEELVQVLTELTGATAVLLRNDSPMREHEGLAREVRPVTGSVPQTVDIPLDLYPGADPGSDSGSVRAIARGLPEKGQKTGFFYDQRANRAAFAALCKDRTVLDLFSYTGGAALAALAAGAQAAICVDSSEIALAQAREAAEVNGFGDRLATLTGDAFEIMEALQAEGQRFGAIALDPPAFIKRRKDMKKGTEAYVKANRMALGLLEADGVFMTTSCSHHLDREAMRKVLARGLGKARREAAVVGHCHQAPDHPVHPAMAETEYLKGFLCLVR